MSHQAIIPADKVLPQKLFVIPIQGKPVFPGIFSPLMIREESDQKVVDLALESNGLVGMVLTTDEDNESPSAADLHKVGTVCKIARKINLPDGGYNIFVSTMQRFVIRKVLRDRDPLVVAVDYPAEVLEDSDEIKALTRALISETKQVSENNPLFSEEMRLNMVNIDQPGRIADFIASILNIGREDQQGVLAEFDIQKRMEAVLLFIRKEQELLRIQKRIQAQINEKIEKSQREFFLKEQLKAIRGELGEPTDAKTSEHQRFTQQIEQLSEHFDPETQTAVERELEKFGLMEPSNPEFNITRNYLETVVSLPWAPAEPESIDLGHARKILDRDHHGLEDVKERILEFLAVRKLRPNSRGSIVCLVGPPGVGKTSVGRSIADALGKRFYRFSVGGMRDEAEIKGHRRTYIGAMPGKIIQGLKYVQTRDPVFMIDEIDKLAVSYQGDPSAALLEVLDPEQNTTFRDNYLDLPFNISDVLFIATANTLDSIPGPLLDRMEVIRLSGYIDEDKIAIAKSYLVPRSLSRAGLNKRDVRYGKTALLHIANGYAREAGMRNFEKSLDKIHRKVARQVVDEAVDLPVQLKTNEDVESYLGRPVFRGDEVKTVSRPGMAIGLAWTNMGGDTLVVEAVSTRGQGDLKLTGKLGDVMQESARIAYTFARHLAPSLGVADDWFDRNSVHLHIPAGATPKDGPSAGITMASTLLSLAMGKQIRNRLAMTGELSLAGSVLPIGGLKEKSIAARRAKIRDIIIPKDNEADLDDIPQHVRNGIRFHPVSTMEEVVGLLF